MLSLISGCQLIFGSKAVRLSSWLAGIATEVKNTLKTVQAGWLVLRQKSKTHWKQCYRYTVRCSPVRQHIAVITQKNLRRLRRYSAPIARTHGAPEVTCVAGSSSSKLVPSSSSSLAG